MASVIPDELRRFLLTGTFSVPHVEAILQLRQTAPAGWNAEHLGARIYVSASRAHDLLADLMAVGIVRAQAENPNSYNYDPGTPELSALLDQLAKSYSEQLVSVTRLIHSADERNARKFAAAFRFRKDT